MKEVFISYISADEEIAKEVLNRLKGAGISCWFAPEDIPAGGNFAHEIPKAIAECNYFVLLLSNEALNSPYVMLELDQARKRRKTILPIKLEQMDLNDEKHFLITTSQAVDATENLTLAVNKVIQRIKGDFSDPAPELYSEKELRTRVWNQEIRCPYCGCTYVKKHTDETGQYFNSGIINGKRFRILRFIDVLRKQKDGVGVLFVAWAVIAIGFMCGYSIYALSSSVFASLVCGMAIFVVLCFGADESVQAYDMLRKTKETISVSGLRYQSLKCVDCEKRFSVLLPTEGKLKEWIPHLIKTDAKK